MGRRYDPPGQGPGPRDQGEGPGPARADVGAAACRWRAAASRGRGRRRGPWHADGGKPAYRGGSQVRARARVRGSPRDREVAELTVLVIAPAADRAFGERAGV